MNFIMAFNNLSKSIRLFFLKKLTKSFLSHIQVSKSLKPIFKSEIIMPPYKNLIRFKNLLPLHRNILMKDPNVYENHINQNKSQTRYSTNSTKDEKKLPPGRHQFHKETENFINEQIGAELNAAFSYLSMACYFGQTDVALPGCQGFFLNMHEEELEHAMVFINYQLLRGGCVVLCDINVPKNQDWKSINRAFFAALDTEKFVKEVFCFNISKYYYVQSWGTTSSKSSWKLGKLLSNTSTIVL